jgi:DNA invertase Pin-like site-specific DNA recombinase
VLVFRTDRLSRRAATLLRFIEEAQDRGQFLLDCAGFDSRSEQALVLAGVASGISHGERQKVIANTKRGMKRRFDEGFNAGGRALGDTTERVKLPNGEERGIRRVHEPEAETVRRIFREFTHGMCLAKIAAGLNKDGIPTPGTN